MKNIFITQSANKQTGLDPNIKIINGSVTPEERAKIYIEFNNGLQKNISITEPVVLLGGVRYKKNNDEINVVFLDDIDDGRKKYILSRMRID